MPEPQEGQDGTIIRYRERLVPPLSWWLFSAAFAGSIGIAYGHFLGVIAGWATTVIVMAVISSMLWRRATPLITVDDLVFRAGPARLPLQFVGEVRVIDAGVVKNLRDTQAEAYLCLRAAVAKEAIAVVVADPEDPHPFWFVSSREPKKLADALIAARDWHS